MNLNKYMFLAFFQLFAGVAWGQELDSQSLQAKRILERLSGSRVPASHALIAPMAEKIKSGDYKGAAEIGTTHPDFLNLTVKLMALKMSNREESFRVELNDFAASFMGVTRDGTDARELLRGNFYYVGDPSKYPAGQTVRADLVADILRSNNHYSDLDNPNKRIDIGRSLMRVEGQRVLDSTDTAVANPDPAGVLTSRAFLEAHATAGTNRRPVEFLFREFMCTPIEAWADTRASDLRIGRDIDRFPGGDHTKYQTTCKGCHTQMDSLRGAFAKWDFQGNRALTGATANRPGGFNASGISNKMNRNNNVYPSGYTTIDDSFVNNSRQPANAALFGWRGTVEGTSLRGVKELGAMVSNSSRFSQCMAKRVYDAVCRTDIDIKTNAGLIQSLALSFEANRYQLKELFKEAVIHPLCIGQ